MNYAHMNLPEAEHRVFMRNLAMSLLKIGIDRRDGQLPKDKDHAAFVDELIEFFEPVACRNLYGLNTTEWMHAREELAAYLSEALTAAELDRSTHFKN